MKEFAEKYKAKYGHEPGYHAGGGYGAGQVLEAAVKKAGSIERDKLRKALFGLDTVTAFGRFKVDTTGKQIGKPAYAVQWLNGERHVVLPAAATARRLSIRSRTGPSANDPRRRTERPPPEA